MKKCYESIQNYADALQKAQESYQKSATNAARNVDDAATKLAQSQREDDKLTSLQTALDNCTLTATMDGTITALNATVGDVCSGTVATIQDVENLTVEVTIPASSVGKLSTGMTCRITSDATGDAVISGTLTRIDPVANDSGSFGATVTVNGQDSGLLIGISAKVEIVISEKDDVFTVPRDAVGTNEDGTTYVLRRTGGEGTDMTFEEVAVTEGDTNDYYVEITGDDLHEGDIISIDGTQGIVVDGPVDLVSAELTGDLDTILSWADEIRLDETCGHANHVRVNADNSEDAALALEFGAEAIGLCRTEHMFLGDRKNIIQSFILSDDEAVKHYG